MTKEAEIKELAELIKKYNKEYYLHDAPTISDAEYDQLFYSCLLYTSDAADE